MEKTGTEPRRPPSFKELAGRPEGLAGGHRLCAGCGESIAVRQALLASPYPVVVVNATGCLEVATTIYPFSAWRTPWIHCGFENAAATASGVEAAYRSLRAKGRIPDREIRVVAIGGDGGTYDIGLQALSGALERGHRFLYICLNNEGYMNTGIQRSSATPAGADTTTSPAGQVIPGKREMRKDLTAIVAAHGIPYVAQTATIPGRIADLAGKVQKALEVDGPAFINVLAPCNRGWRTDPAETIRIAQLAVDSCYWPLFEIVDGKWRLTYRPKDKRPLAEWLGAQGRFAHLLRPENRPLVERLQARIDQEWATLLARCDG